MLGILLHTFNCLKENTQDFLGQDLSYKIHEYILLTSAIIAFCFGFIYQRFLYTFLILSGGLLLTALICIPSWPIYCRNKVKWLPAESREKEREKEKDL